MTGFLIYLTQITLIMALVLFLSRINSQRAARAHAILLAGLVIVFLLPGFSMLAANLGLGFLPATALKTDTAIEHPAERGMANLNTLPFVEDSLPISESPNIENNHENTAAITSTSLTPTIKYWFSAINWLMIFGVAWGSCSLLVLIKLTVGTMNAIRVHNSTIPVTQQNLLEALARAKRALGISREVKLVTSELASCPMIWCWSQPTIIVPAKSTNRSVDWHSVFCHELAHLVRRDHVSTLIAELGQMVFPWHPLMHRVHKNLHQLSERACDTWAIQKSDPADYAEAILCFAPSRAMPLMSPMATRNHELHNRVVEILESRPGQPRLGWTWVSFLTLLTVSVATLTAMASVNSPPTAAEFVEQARISQQDEDAWKKQLKNINENSPWHVGYKAGMGLAVLPGDAAFEILDSAWDDIPGNARQQIMKGFLPAFQKSEELNPRLYDVLNLGMYSKQKDVQESAQIYLSWMTLNKFKAGSKKYKAWRKKNKRKTAEEITTNGCKDYVKALREKKTTSDVRSSLKLMEEASSNIDNLPLMKNALSEAGFGELVKQLVANKKINGNHPAAIAFKDLSDLGDDFNQQDFDESEQRIVRDLLAAQEGSNWQVGAQLGRMLAQLPGDRAFDVLSVTWDEIASSVRPQLLKGFQPWIARDGMLNDAYFDVMHLGMNSSDEQSRKFARSYLQSIVLRDFDPNSYATWYKKTEKMTAREIVESEATSFVKRMADDPIGSLEIISGAGANIRELPLFKEALVEAGLSEQLSTVISKTKGQQAESVKGILNLLDGKREDVVDQAEFNGQPIVERFAKDDKNKQYFQIGPSAMADRPKDGWKVVLMLPGGGGGVDFQGFCRRIHANALPDGYIAVQVIAPQWSDADNRVVWPTKSLNPDKAKFTTESLIRDIVGDLKEHAEIDTSKVFALGWSSSGPALYENATAKNNPIKGSFIAMSVFHPQRLKHIKRVSEHAFYLFHSPQDWIKIGQHAEVAVKQLASHGAKTKLTKYQGGHGWHEDPFGNINKGMKWLEANSSRK